MAIIATHNKVDSQPDDPSVAMAGGVVPSDWNAEHVVNIEDGTFTQQMFAEGVLPDQYVNTDSDVTFEYVQANADFGFQLTGALNAYWYHGVSGATNGFFLESDAGSNAGWFIRPSSVTSGAFLSNGQVVLGGGITPLHGGVSPVALTVRGDLAVSTYSWFKDIIYGTYAEWESAGGLNSIYFIQKYVNTRIDPDNMSGTGVGHLFQQFYYDPDTPDEANIGATTWHCEGNWTIDPTTRNSTMVLQNVKNGVLQDVLTIDSDCNATIPGTFTSAAIATTIIDGINQTYGTVVDGSYYTMYKAPYAGTINSLSHIVRSLTTAGTVNVQINGVDVTGLTGIVPTVSGDTTVASAANTFVAGDSISLLFASTLAIVDFQYTLNLTRATS